MTKEVRKSVYISCKATGLSSSNYVHWYQQKDSEALRRILYVRSGRQDPIYDNHPEANDFKVRKQSDNYELKIEVLKEIHSGVYYCASWGTSSHSKSIHSECVQKPRCHTTIAETAQEYLNYNYSNTDNSVTVISHIAYQSTMCW